MQPAGRDESWFGVVLVALVLVSRTRHTVCLSAGLIGLVDAPGDMPGPRLHRIACCWTPS